MDRLSPRDGRVSLDALLNLVDILFEDPVTGALYSAHHVTNTNCHVLVELSELDRKATLASCRNRDEDTDEDN